jgi:gliding motility-associated lipoprotein GldH
MRLLHYIVLFLLFVTAWGCGKDTTEARADWDFSAPLSYRDTLVFDFNIRDTSKAYFLGMDVDFDYIEYPFQNIYLWIDTRYPVGETQEEMINLDFSDKKGVIKGDCFGTTCKLPLYLQRNIHFDQAGAYQIRLVQNTRRDSLPGIQSMSLVLGLEEI